MESTSHIPPFWQRVSDLYRDSVAHAFVLHGNVYDYVAGGGAYQRLDSFLTTRLAAGFDIVAVVDPAQGLRFPIPKHRELALQVLGVNPATPGAVAQLLGAPGKGVRPPMPQRDLLQLITQVLDTLLTAPFEVEQAGKKTKRQGRVAVIFEYGDLLFPDSDLRSSDAPTLARLLQWARSAQVGEARHLLFIVGESLLALHSELRRASSRWESIAVPLPGVDERARFVAHLQQQYDDLETAEDLTPAAVAAATGALNLLQIEDIVFRALGAGQLTRGLIFERKQDIIRQEFADVLQVQEPRFTLARVGGYSYLKAFFAERVIAPWRGGKLAMGGLLLSGPPGTGKTQLAEALAGSAGVPFVVFSLAKILGEYVGNSERNLERALNAVLSLAPCILFMDEIDQLTGRGESGANGVDNRVFARLLTFLEDPARMGKVLLVASTNRPDLLDAALRSRFDRTAPVLPPTEDDRAEIIQTLATALGIHGVDDSIDLWEAVAATDGWTGRNLRDLMRVTAELVDDGQAPYAALTAAREIYVPKLRDVQQMTQLALSEITDLRLVPPEYRAQVRAAQTETAEQPVEPTRRRRGEGGVL